jgi:hypothetical protein
LGASKPSVSIDEPACSRARPTLWPSIVDPDSDQNMTANSSQINAAQTSS